MLLERSQRSETQSLWSSYFDKWIQKMRDPKELRFSFSEVLISTKEFKKMRDPIELRFSLSEILISTKEFKKWGTNLYEKSKFLFDKIRYKTIEVWKELAIKLQRAICIDFLSSILFSFTGVLSILPSEWRKKYRYLWKICFFRNVVIAWTVDNIERQLESLYNKIKSFGWLRKQVIVNVQNQRKINLFPYLLQFQSTNPRKLFGAWRSKVTNGSSLFIRVIHLVEIG